MKKPRAIAPDKAPLPLATGDAQADRLAPVFIPTESPYGRLERRSTRWYLINTRPDVAMKLRRLFVGVSRAEREAIRLPDSMPGFWAEMNWFMMMYPFTVNEPDRAALERLLRTDLTRANAVISFNAHLAKPPLIHMDLKLPLRAYQAKGVEVIALQKRILIADDVGLGKTAVAIAAVSHTRRTPALFVTMTQLARQTVREFGKFLDAICVTEDGRYHLMDDRQRMDAPPLEGALVIHPIETLTPYALPPADVYVMRYSCLRGWTEVFAEGRFRFVVFDECQELRRKGTEKYKAAQLVARHAEYAVGLTATPIYNYGDEAFHILDLLRPKCLGKLKEFVAAWGRVSPYGRILIDEPAALGAMLREHLFMLRRTKQEVGLELPEVQCVIEYVDHDVKLFNQSIGEILELAKRTLFGFTMEDRVTSSGLFDIRLRQATGLSKAHYVAARTRILLESGQPVILVGWHRDVYDIWIHLLADYKPLLITGSESPARKDANKRAFIAGESPLLILSLRSGEGMDGLQDACSIVVFGELDWSPQIHHQIIGRLHRYGQRDSVLALFLLSREGSDPAVAGILDLKSEQAFHIMNPGESHLPSLETHGGEKRLQEIALRILEQYAVDLDKARAEFETKEPAGYWGVLAALEAFAWDRVPDEKRCQEMVHDFLEAMGVRVEREVALGEGVIDMLTEDGVGVELKTAFVSPGALLRQVRAYLRDDRARAIIVATPDPGNLPGRLLGKRVTEVSLRGRWILSGEA